VCSILTVCCILFCFQIFLGPLSRVCCVSAVPYCPVSVDHGSYQREPSYDLELDLDPAADIDHHQRPSLEQTLSDIRSYLRLLAAAARTDAVRQGAEPSHRDLVVGEWQHVAVVIDRVSFIVFSLVSVIVTIALYVR